MRPIKFRAWDKERRIWLNPVNYAHSFDGYIMVINGNGWMGKTSDFIVEQFTGLHDKNGREIYEGDVVLNRDSGFKGFVIWNQENCCFALDDWHIDWFDSDDRKGYEVIGNIHENPELLK